MYLVITSTNFRDRTECCGNHPSAVSPPERKAGEPSLLESPRPSPHTAQSAAALALEGKTRCETRRSAFLTSHHQESLLTFPRHVSSICLLTSRGNPEAKGEPCIHTTSCLFLAQPLACFLKLPDSLPNPKPAKIREFLPNLTSVSSPACNAMHSLNSPLCLCSSLHHDFYSLPTSPHQGLLASPLQNHQYLQHAIQTKVTAEAQQETPASRPSPTLVPLSGGSQTVS